MGISKGSAFELYLKNNLTTRCIQWRQLCLCSSKKARGKKKADKVDSIKPTLLLGDDESLIACRPGHGRRQEAATNERLGLARILNTRFYLDSRPELRNTEVAHIPR